MMVLRANYSHGFSWWTARGWSPWANEAIRISSDELDATMDRAKAVAGTYNMNITTVHAPSGEACAVLGRDRVGSREWREVNL